MEVLKVKTSQRQEFIDISRQVREIVSSSGVKEGICVVFCPHTTAALTINENADPAVTQDMIKFTNRLIPESAGFSHSEGNSDAHIKSSLFGHSLTLIVNNGTLSSGVWQGIYFCEFDGPRTRQVFVRVHK